MYSCKEPVNTKQQLERKQLKEYYLIVLIVIKWIIHISFGQSEVTFISIHQDFQVHFLSIKYVVHCILWLWSDCYFECVFVINNCSSHWIQKKTTCIWRLLFHILFSRNKRKPEIHLEMHFGNKYIFICNWSLLLLLKKELNNALCEFVQNT